MKPLVRGQETDLIEILASWHLDDLPPALPQGRLVDAESICLSAVRLNSINLMR